MKRGQAWARLKVHELLNTKGVEGLVLEELAQQSALRGYNLTQEQTHAWQRSVDIVSKALNTCCMEDKSFDHWSLLFEYEIPRRGKRPDVVLLGHGVIFVVEMKIGSESYSRADCLQVEDYVKDLRDFHEESRGLDVVPILCASEAKETFVDSSTDAVQRVSPETLGTLLSSIHSKYRNRNLINADFWENSGYKPTPGIIEAALDVYSGHEVREISFADADNLTKTVNEIRDLIRQAQIQSERIACFVTGVPGSGKTLAGLSTVHLETGFGESETIGTYLSGNGPLVDVLQYALALDIKKRDEITMKEAKRLSEIMVQMVHRFIKFEAFRSAPPPENVIVFDEAQRAWDARQMWRKQKIEKSEAELTFEIMSRANDWSVVVALVGEGQEINTGEAGISEWMDAPRSFPEWKVHISPHVENELGDRAIESSNLHLSVGVRAPRGRVLSNWIEAVLSGDASSASLALSENQDYPILITRDLEEMRSYLRDRSSVDRRVGLLASAQARRLRALGIEMSNEFQSGINWPRWFIDLQADLRSSYSLEVAASEFKCQGLEIDWAGLCWGSDFLYVDKAKKWESQKFRGSRWTKDKDSTEAKNRYRVLLSRARYGLVIWLPIYPDYSKENNVGMSETYDFLKRCGAVDLSD